MLYKVENNTPVEWRGERLNGISHPRQIENVWTEADLNAIGLYKAKAPDPVPDGYVVTDTTLEIVDGVPKWVNTLVEDQRVAINAVLDTFPAVDGKTFKKFQDEGWRYIKLSPYYDRNYRLVAAKIDMPEEEREGGGVAMLNELGAVISRGKELGIPTLGFHSPQPIIDYAVNNHGMVATDGHIGKFTYLPADQLADSTTAWRNATKVTRFQFIEALRDAGQLQGFINAARAVAGKDKRAFEQVTEVRRNAKFIEAVRQQVGASQEAVDNLFKAAQAIEE